MLTLVYCYSLLSTISHPACPVFFGGDLDDIEAGGDVDASIEHDAGIDFQFITFKNLTAFFTVFGWAGIASIDAGLGLGYTLLISLFQDCSSWLLWPALCI